MFTGIIETTAEILDPTPAIFRVSRPSSFDDIRIGSSIAVSGVCLTITALKADMMEFNVIEETLGKTKLGTLHIGDRVNLERAMKADGRLDGHIVQGHVEGVGKVLKFENGILYIMMAKNLITNIVQKGSITIDGVSLTVAGVDGDVISVALIPFTIRETTLGNLTTGAKVNIETDILMRMASNNSST